MKLQNITAGFGQQGAMRFRCTRRNKSIPAARTWDRWSGDGDGAAGRPNDLTTSVDGATQGLQPKSSYFQCLFDQSQQVEDWI